MGCICGAIEASVVMAGKFNRHGCVDYPFRVLRCRRCGLHRTDPPPYQGLADAERFYSQGSGGGEGEALDLTGEIDPEMQALASRLAEDILRQLAPFASAGRLLDVGCSTGALLAAAQQHGYEVAGVEVNQAAAQYARQRTGAPVATGSLESEELPERSFDVITLNHVFEHVVDPPALLARIQALLKPGGLLFIGVPNFAGLMRQLHRENWYGLSPNYHLWQFTPPTLARLISDAGYRVERINTRGNMEYEFGGGWRGLVRQAVCTAGTLLARGDNLALIARSPV